MSDFDTSVPIDEAFTPPSVWYTGAEFAAVERARVFSSGWQFVARSDQLTNPGEFVTGEVAGEPYLITRGDDGVLRAFFNVCRHHAAEVAHGSGCAHEFQCPYHGWTYRNDGSLKKAPKLGAAKNFHPKDYGLVEMPVTSWGPFVGIQLRPKKEGSSLNASELFGEINEHFKSSGWTDLQFVARRSWDLECNWKVYVDNYLDGGYHVDVLHKELASRLDLDAYQTHAYERSVLQVCGGTGDVRVGEHALYGWVYPNFMLNRYGPWLDSNLVLPLGATRCRVIFDYFCAVEKASDQDFIAASMRSSEQVQQEDIAICESVQRGLSSRGYERGRYAPGLEIGEYLFHSLLQQDMTPSP